MRHLFFVIRYKAIRYLSGLLALILLLFTIAQPRYAEADTAFVLHSYHQEYPWTKQENKGLVTALKGNFPDSDIMISTEYLDTKRVAFTEEYQEFFARYLRKKYTGYTPDILFVSDDNALKFMMHYRNTIFPGTPIVFCGVNDTSFQEKVQDTKIYGVFEVKDITRNLHLIKKLFPEIDAVTFVGDDSPTYEAIHRQILASAASELPNYSLNFAASRDIVRVENLIKASPDRVIVLTTIGGFHEYENINLSISSAIRRIRSLGNFAMVSMEDVYMKDGILGGIVTSGQSQGKSAAEIGIQVLSGNPPDNKRFVLGANIPSFDHRELQRLRISKSQLPSDAIILNQSISFFKEFKEIVFSIIIIFLTLCILISFLLITLSRQKKAEKELKASRNFLNSVLDNLPDMVFVKDAKNLRFVQLNKAGEKIFGEKSDQIIGKNDYDFFSKEEADFFTFKDREVFTSKCLLDIPIESIQTKHGKRYLHTKKIPILDEEANPVFLLGISRDITVERAAASEKLELQDKLKQAQKMEAIGTLAGGIAHDFNNILSAIIGYTQIAQLQSNIPDQVRKYLDGTMKGAERAKQLVRQILTFSRKNEQHHNPVVLSEIVIESLELVRSSLPSTITINQDIQSTSYVHADATQLHQVVMNLCTNGYQAMQETGGILEVNLSEIRVSVSSESPIAGMKAGRYAQLTVFDSGKGMEQGVAERIFDPYFTTKGPAGGTGLGLAVVHGIITSHYGSIGVESEPGKGTKITVCLPIANISTGIPLSDKETKRIENYETGKGEQILLVDDEPDIVAITENLLNQHGYHVTSFTSSKEALHVYTEQTERFDLVITDMTMPELTGSELSQRILESNPSAAIIICTGFSDALNREKAKAIGIKGYCEKPVSIDTLLSTIATTLAGKRTS